MAYQDQGFTAEERQRVRDFRRANLSLRLRQVGAGLQGKPIPQDSAMSLSEQVALATPVLKDLATQERGYAKQALDERMKRLEDQRMRYKAALDAQTEQDKMRSRESVARARLATAGLEKEIARIDQQIDEFQKLDANTDRAVKAAVDQANMDYKREIAAAKAAYIRDNPEDPKALGFSPMDAAGADPLLAGYREAVVRNGAQWLARLPQADAVERPEMVHNYFSALAAESGTTLDNVVGGLEAAGVLQKGAYEGLLHAADEKLQGIEVAKANAIVERERRSEAIGHSSAKTDARARSLLQSAVPVLRGEHPVSRAGWAQLQAQREAAMAAPVPGHRTADAGLDALAAAGGGAESMGAPHVISAARAEMVGANPQRNEIPEYHPDAPIDDERFANMGEYQQWLQEPADPLNRHRRMLDEIMNPELRIPMLQRLKRDLMESDGFQRYTTHKGYGSDMEFALRQYKRDVSRATRQNTKRLRVVARANRRHGVDAGPERASGMSDGRPTQDG